jgi:Cytochrome c7 and related cytochrome c
MAGSQTLRGARRLVLLAGAALVVFGAAGCGGRPRARENSAIFTPAHRSVGDAVRDFFGWHPAPVQPVPFSHKIHLAKKIKCVGCHTGVEVGPDAGMPDIRTCMTCHVDIAVNLPGVKIVRGYAARGEDIAWQRVYTFPRSAHVMFNHAPHVRAGVRCAACHGDMTQQGYAVRAVNLTMGFCVNCHRLNNASVDCVTCHD